MSQFGLFDLSDRLLALSRFGDPLERLNHGVDFEMFCPALASGFHFLGLDLCENVPDAAVRLPLWGGDTAYRNQANEKLLVENGFCSQLDRKKPKKKPMPLRTQRANGKKSKIRAFVEHVFAVQKERMRLFIRTIGLQRARIKITLATLTYNLQRLIFGEKRGAPTG